MLRGAVRVGELVEQIKVEALVLDLFLAKAHLLLNHADLIPSHAYIIHAHVVDFQVVISMSRSVMKVRFAPKERLRIGVLAAVDRQTPRVPANRAKFRFAPPFSEAELEFRALLENIVGYKIDVLVFGLVDLLDDLLEFLLLFDFGVLDVHVDLEGAFLLLAGVLLGFALGLLVLAELLLFFPLALDFLVGGLEFGGGGPLLLHLVEDLRLH
mmetsp:Transcript_43377/g.51003  ORF Transcript_43377/g.51003 Transcript_43377/m.51003 type:complete len:212 (-) Transcript_43377:39-674(-)